RATADRPDAGSDRRLAIIRHQVQRPELRSRPRHGGHLRLDAAPRLRHFDEEQPRGPDASEAAAKRPDRNAGRQRLRRRAEEDDGEYTKTQKSFSSYAVREIKPAPSRTTL